MTKTKRMADMPTAERPREKFIHKGAAALSDQELLALIIGSGNATADVTEISRRIYRLMRKQMNLPTLQDLISLKGVSTVTAAKILASLEMARRHLVRDVEPLTSMNDILTRFSDIRGRQQEYVACMSLDGGQRLIAQRIIAIGTLDNVMIHPREIFSDAVADHAASIIVAHNHPSGRALPSAHDLVMTQQLVSAGHLLGVKIQDHIILTKSDFYSYRQKHLL